MHNPFKSSTRRAQFEAVIRDFEARIPALFRADGRANEANNIGNAFWRGYRGEAAHWIDPATPLYVAYAAGREAARSTPQAAEGARPVSTDPAATGYWREPNPYVTPGAKLAWTRPGRGGLQVWIGRIGLHKVATIRRHPANIGSTCVASLAGWMWTNSQPGTAASMLGVKETSPRGFESVLAAKKAIAQAIAQAPAAPNA